MKKIYFVICFCLFLVLGCNKNFTNNIPKNEVKLEQIEIPGLMKGTELSGIALYNDSLLFILPENFNKYSSESYIFSIDKKFVTDAFASKKIDEINKVNIQFNEGVNIDDAQGLESVCFLGDTVFFSLERNNYTAFLLKGIFYPGKNLIIINKSTLIEHPLNEKIKNATIEAIFVFNDDIYCFHECNGKVNNNSEAIVCVYNTNLDFIKYLPVEELEYRITDVSTVTENSFYATNYYFAEKEFESYKPEDDKLIKYIGSEFSHYQYIKNNDYLEEVERIVKFDISEDSIYFTDNKPYYIEIENEGKNIEGIESLLFKNNLYLLIVTDRFPEDNLYFVKIEN